VLDLEVGLDVNHDGVTFSTGENEGCNCERCHVSASMKVAGIFEQLFLKRSNKKPPVLAIFCFGDYSFSSFFSAFSGFVLSSLRERPRRCSFGSTDTMRNFMTSPGFARVVGSSTGLSESSETCASP
jgi:hypothetical protein